MKGDVAGMKNEKKKKGGCLAMLLYVAIGFACGIVMSDYMMDTLPSGASMGEEVLSIFAVLAVMYAAIIFATIIHEAGHLVFGLLSGYKFSSFRIFGLMLVRERGKLRLRSFSLAGTAGQCLMSPPEFTSEGIPVILYNLGGIIMNLLTAAVALPIAYLTRDISFLSMLLTVLGIVNIALALINGIPASNGGVANDGYNARSLSRDVDACRAFWVQLKINEAVTMGTRLKDMPEFWFYTAPDEGLLNVHVASVAVFNANRLMDMRCFDEADALMAHLLEADTAMIGIYRSLITLDRIYLAALRGDDMLARELYTPEIKRFAASMKRFPAVIRCEYAFLRLCERDEESAAAKLAFFERIAKKYPYQSDLDGERELIQLAKNSSCCESKAVLREKEETDGNENAANDGEQS